MLLIVAVGSNYALFFDQRADAKGMDRVATLASLVLACTTTVIGFGVLAFSKVPVLQAIGATVGPGAVLALLFSAILADNRAAPSARGDGRMMDIVHPKAPLTPRWRPTPLTARHDAAARVRDAATVLMLPEIWPFAVWALAGNHVLLGFGTVEPRSSLLGPNLTRLPASSAARGEVALTIDDGPDPLVTPQVLDILDRHGAKASFFCVGDEALRYPDVCREIVRRGHAVENHSQSHSHYFAAFGPRRIAADVDHGQQTLRALTGETPRFFRPTAGLRNVFLDPVLARRGLQLASWTRRGFDTRERRADVVFGRLVHNFERWRHSDVARWQCRTHRGWGAGDTRSPPAPAGRHPGRRTSPGDAAQRHSVTAAFHRALLDAASAPYRSAGRFAWHFSRSKLKRDPVFVGLLERGVIPDAQRLVDLGCGQGLLASWLRSAKALHDAGHWRPDWPAPPDVGRIFGLELMPKDVERARVALAGRGGEFELGDLRTADFGKADVVRHSGCPALHRLSRPAECIASRARRIAARRIVRRPRRRRDGGAAVPRQPVGRPDGLLLPRSPHASNYCRSTADWTTILEQLGFRVEAIPMSRRTPFANVMLIARVDAVCLSTPR